MPAASAYSMDWLGCVTEFSCAFFFFSSRRRHTSYWRDWSSDVCSSDLQGHRSHRTGFLALVMSGRGEGGQRAREPRMQQLEVVPLRHPAHGVAAASQVCFDLVPGAAERRDTTHAGNDDALHQIIPPLTPITWRVIYEAASDIRKLTTDATSSGCPTRFIGTVFNACSSGTPSSMPVSINPGATQFTVMLRVASSTARSEERV